MKVNDIRTELDKTELFIHIKYECKKAVINEEFADLIAKYNEKNKKQERLFKIELHKSIKKTGKICRPQWSYSSEISPLSCTAPSVESRHGRKASTSLTP